MKRTDHLANRLGARTSRYRVRVVPPLLILTSGFAYYSTVQQSKQINMPHSAYRVIVSPNPRVRIYATAVMTCIYSESFGFALQLQSGRVCQWRSLLPNIYGKISPATDEFPKLTRPVPKKQPRPSDERMSTGHPALVSYTDVVNDGETEKKSRTT